MNVIVELRSREDIGIKSYWVNFLIVSYHRENSSESIV